MIDIENGGGKMNNFVDLRDALAIDALHKEFPSKTYQQIKDAIGKYGPLREEIVFHLTRMVQAENKNNQKNP